MDMKVCLHTDTYVCPTMKTSTHLHGEHGLDIQSTWTRVHRIYVDSLLLDDNPCRHENAFCCI